jgi:hypothetical protein
MLDGASKLQAPIRGGDPRRAAQQLHRSEESVDSMLDDLLDGARPAIAGVAREAHAQPIPVHHPAHLGRRKKDAVLHALDPQKAVTGAMGADLALDDPSGVRSRRCSTRRSRYADRSGTQRRCLRATFPGRRGHGGPACAIAPSDRALPVSAAFAAQRGPSLGVWTRLAVPAPELASTRFQLTAPDPLRRLRAPKTGIPVDLPGWRNW